MKPERIAELTQRRDALAAQVQALRADPPISRRKPKDGTPPGPPKYWLTEVEGIEILVQRLDKIILDWTPAPVEEVSPPASVDQRPPLVRTGVDVARIPKSKRAEVRVSVSNWKGQRIVDVRVWCIPKGRDEWVPSRKGVSVEAGKIDALLSALVLAKQHIVGLG